MQCFGQQYHLVQRLLKKPVKPERETWDKGSHVLTLLPKRIDKAWAAGLFEGSVCCRYVKYETIVIEQARVAFDHYGLVYDPNARWWKFPTKQEEAELVQGGELKHRHSEWFRKTYKGDLDYGISRLDLTLIGESLRLPLCSFELAKDQEEVFDRHVAAAKEGFDLLADGFHFLTCNAGIFFRNGTAGRRIEVIREEEYEEFMLRGITVDPPDPAESIRVGERIVILVPLLDRFKRTQVILLEQGGHDRDVSLLSPGWLVDDDPWFEGRHAKVPRHDRPKGPRLKASHAGRSDLIAILVDSDEMIVPMRNDNYTETRIPEVKQDDLEEAKYRLLALGPDRWCAKRIQFSVVS
jgi:hypothetical protein